MKTTTYYYAMTNSYNKIIATDGEKAISFSCNSNGIDTSSGVDLYCTYEETLEDKIKELKNAYKDLDEVYGLLHMDDIEEDFPDDIYSFNKDDFEALIEIITVDRSYRNM